VRGRRQGPARWWAWWRVGVPVLIALSFCDAALAEPVGPRGGKTVASPKRPRSRPVPALGHTVHAGDSLWIIARRYGVSLEALSRANGIQPGQQLYVGQQLTIPGAPVEESRQEPPSLSPIVLAAPPESHRVAFMWPLAAQVASPFGPRGATWHGGIDLRAERGTPIRAAAPGMVITSGWERAYGNVIKIWHVMDLMTVYAHNHENSVRVGDWVERGQVIGTVGSTGRATAPHLHFEIRLDGRKYDPLFWLPAPRALDVATSGPGRPAAVRWAP